MKLNYTQLLQDLHFHIKLKVKVAIATPSLLNTLPLQVESCSSVRILA